MIIIIARNNFWRTICVNATVRAILVDFIDAEEEWIVENVDDALARHYRIITIWTRSSVLVILKFKRVMCALLNNHRTMHLGRKDYFRFTARLALVFKTIFVILLIICQALSCGTTINLPIIFLLIAMQKAHFPPLLTCEQVGRFWHWVCLGWCHFSFNCHVYVQYRVTNQCFHVTELSVSYETLKKPHDFIFCARSFVYVDNKKFIYG